MRCRGCETTPIRLQKITKGRFFLYLSTPQELDTSEQGKKSHFFTSQATHRLILPKALKRSLRSPSVVSSLMFVTLIFVWSSPMDMGFDAPSGPDSPLPAKPTFLLGGTYLPAPPTPRPIMPPPPPFWRFAGQVEERERRRYAGGNTIRRGQRRHGRGEQEHGGGGALGR